MHVDVIDNFDALRHARSDWDSVYAQDPDAQVYMSWAWIFSWFDKLGSQWIVLAARESATSPRYIGFLPLQLRTERSADGIFRNELRTGGGYFAGYTGYICDPQFEPSVTRAFTEHMKRMHWSRLHLENFALSPDRLGRFLEDFREPDFVVGKVKRPDDGDGIDHDIYVYVDLPGEWEEFLDERMGAKTRRNARRTLRQVGDGTGFRITHVSAETIHGDLEALFKYWEIQWAAKLAERYNPALPRGMMRNFHRMLLASFEHDTLFLPVLWQGDVRIGVQASLIDRKNRSLISLLNGRDLTVKRPPPGFALHLHSLKWAIENGFRTYDLQTGDFSYKYDFGGIERRVECLLVRTADLKNIGHRLDGRSLPVVLARCRALFQAGKMREAETGCRQILEADASFDGAIRLLSEIREAPKPSFSKSLAEASQMHRSGRLPEAEEICRALLSDDALNFDAAYMLGVVMLQQKRYDAAERQLSAAIAIKPSVASAHYNRGVALLGLGRANDALASLSQAISLRPDYQRAVDLRQSVMGKIRKGDNDAQLA